MTNKDDGTCFYLHENGSLIEKPISVLDNDPDYFNSPFVKHAWVMLNRSRLEAWRVVTEAMALGADPSGMKYLTDFWNMDLDDALRYMVREKKPTELRKTGLAMLIEDVFGYDYDEVIDTICEYASVLQKQMLSETVEDLQVLAIGGLRPNRRLTTTPKMDG